MKKQLALISTMALLMCMFAVTAAAQMTGTVKGSTKGDDGNPIVGATVELQSLDTGRKVTLKTDKKGTYFSMGIQPGAYKFTLIGTNGQTLWFFNNIQVKLGGDTEVNFDLPKEKATAAKASGISEAQQKQIEQAEKDNQKIKGLNALLMEAQTDRQTGNWDGAIAAMQKATQQDATKDILWYSLGESYLGAKKYPEAIDAYKKAIALAPTKGEYHNNLGQAYVKSGQIDLAITEYNAAAQADPTNAGMYYFNLGAVLTNMGKADEAVQAFDKAIAADPNKADAYYWKGVDMLGKATVGKDGKMIAPDGTAEALNKYLELQPTGPYAEAAKQLLASFSASIETTFGKGKQEPKKGKKR